MRKISLLDCTLRDGGYMNDWKFGEKAIPDMIDDLENSGVDILELGFFKDEEYKKDRTVFNRLEQVTTLIPDKKKNIQYAMMVEVVNPIPLEMLQERQDNSVDIIRVIVWKTKHDKDGNTVDALQEGYEYCKGIVEKGYKLCVQPARSDQYSDDEFIQMLKMFEKLNPMAIYVVDSWGTQSSKNIMHYVYLADKVLEQKIAIGYHGHNNMMQALGIAADFLHESLDRDIIVDASVYGIGRGAGNLNSELIARYMNEELETSYNITPMIDVYSKYIKTIFEQTPWGYSIPHYITALYNCNPNYGAYLGYDLGLSPTIIEKIIEDMPVEDRVIYTKQKADKFAQKYLN